MRKYPSDKYPREVAAFRRMQQRVKWNGSYTTWPMDRKGFNAFFSSVGKIPDNMLDPSLGRKDHSKGYEPGNCKWQDRKENNGEPHSRPETRKIQSDRCKRLFSKPGIRKRYAKMMKERAPKIWTLENRKKASLRMMGNKINSKRQK